MSDTIHLGYEVGTGRPVEIPLRHMVVSGITQEAGKTTTLEALISRSKRKALAFVTKRGEASFAAGRRIEPYFRERADWQFVASVLEATMREKMKFERNWIIRASKGARSLADVQRNVKQLLQTAKGINEGVYTTLDAYLDIVVPRIAQVRFAPRLDLREGINVLDVANRATFPPELQSLVMRSCLEWVYEHEQQTISIMPEAWEFLPQGRGSPVKLAAIELIRKGANLENYLWLDSQDFGGVDKELLRMCPVWLIGVQREANEVKRTLENIPAGTRKPSAADIATLEKGQFYACFGKHAIKTYVQPCWMSSETAIAVAKGHSSPSVAPTAAHPISTEEAEDTMSSATDKKLDTLIDLITRTMGQPQMTAAAPAPASETRTGHAGPGVGEQSPQSNYVPIFDEDALYERFRARLAQDAPKLIKVLTSAPSIDVVVQEQTIEVDGSSLRGKVALLISKGFFDQVTTGNSAFNELKRQGASVAKPSVYRECDNLAAMGFLTKEQGGGYKAVAGMKVNIVKG